MSGEADKTHLALLFGLVQRFEHSPFGVRQFGVIIVADRVNLPEVDMIGL